jgi:hypothetical protein
MSMPEKQSQKILWTADVISQYLGISKPRFYKLVKSGLPAVIINGSWCAYTDNLEEYFQRITAGATDDSATDKE